VTPSELRVRRVSHRATWSNGCSIPCGCSSTENATRNSVSKSFIWSQGPPGFGRAFQGLTKKASFAKALTAATQAAKRGPTYNPVA